MSNVNEKIAPKLIGMDVTKQKEIDRIMVGPSFTEADVGIFLASCTCDHSPDCQCESILLQKVIYVCEESCQRQLECKTDRSKTLLL